MHSSALSLVYTPIGMPRVHIDFRGALDALGTLQQQQRPLKHFHVASATALAAICDGRPRCAEVQRNSVFESGLG